MTLRRRLSCVLLFLCTICLSYSPVLVSAAVVTLGSIEIFKTHEWFYSKPTVYFHCKGENKTVLPDVKEKHVLYTFKGEESWQPLTELEDVKCKRCGMYEKETIKSDDIFDEWELCASDFNTSDGQYIRFKEKEFNATFLCPECASHASASKNQILNRINSSDLIHWAVIVVISALVSTVFMVVLVGVYKYWESRKKRKEQARFLKLFEEADDDTEDELGIGPLSHVL